ncbi:HTH-type transcriptional repressor AcnR [Brevundimonas sp. SH203]|nr:HTH-type transcriptional repressor AcnR [Brevundimonas sp. SH203]
MEAARACVAELGFHGASIQTVCTKAGVSSGKLFHYFENKRALMLAVVEDQGQRLQSHLDLLVKEADAAEAVLGFMDDILSLASDGAETRLILEIAAEAARDQAVAALVRDQDSCLSNGLESLVARAVAVGAAKPMLSERQTADLLMLMIDGVFSRVSSNSSFDPEAERAPLRKVLAMVLGLNATPDHD